MSQSSTYPSNKLLSIPNVTPWNIYLLELLFAFPDLGVAIRSGIPFELSEPTIDDLFKGTNTKKYGFKRDGVTLTNESRKDFLNSMNLYSKLEARRKDEEAKVCALITSSFSEEAKMQLRTNEAYIKASNSNDSFKMFTIAKAAHTRATSFAVAQHSFLQLLKLKMTNSFTDYVDKLLAQKDAFVAIFDPEGTGVMAIENILTMVLVNGLPDEFKYMKDLMYSKDLMGAFPDFKETLQAMMNYDLNKQKVDVAVTIEAPPNPTILTATSTVGIKAPCSVCNKLFNATLRKVDGKRHTQCYPCNLKAREVRDTARDSVTATPTPTQVASAQASLKKVQAVLLAARVVTSAESINPSPPPYTADQLNKYVMSENFLLTATTTLLPGSAKPATRPWIPDSGATFSTSDELSDLNRPSKLSAPIPITGANGDLIYAIHVGVSYFDPRLNVYFVPQSAVKLVSLGALSALGYMVHTDKDRSIVITAASGSILCACPIQPNNTWIFPSFLMTGKNSPTNAVATAVPTGISGTSGANVLPFLVPHDQRHFTKEEVKRATDARHLHHFMGHPNDRALKLTLDQGLLSHHTHLTSLDVDLMTEFFGSCIACSVGKLHNTDLHITSLSPPSLRIGQCIFFDLQLLTTPSIGGNTQVLIAIDDRSGFISVLGSKSKDHNDIMLCLKQLIASYNARRHQVFAFNSDSEAICLSLATPLGLLNAHITHTTPDAHCHKVERAIQQIDQKATAILESLPYTLPTKLILYLKKYCADCIKLTCSSTQHPDTIPYVAFHRVKPQFNSDPSKSFLVFGTVCLIKHTEGKRASLASKLNLNIHHVSKASIGVMLGFSDHHPGNAIFYSPPSTTPLIRDNYEVVSVIPFDWKPKPVIQQTYITNINPAYQDILHRDDYPQPNQTVGSIASPSVDLSASSAEINSVTENLLPTADSPVSDSDSATGPDFDHPRPISVQSNLDAISAQFSPKLPPTLPTHRYPIHEHHVPSHLACNLSTLPDTTKCI